MPDDVKPTGPVALTLVLLPRPTVHVRRAVVEPVLVISLADLEERRLDLFDLERAQLEECLKYGAGLGYAVGCGVWVVPCGVPG